MTSKKNNQKPVEQKLDADAGDQTLATQEQAENGEPVNGTIDTKAGATVEAGAEQASTANAGDQPPINPGAENGDQPSAPAAIEEPQQSDEQDEDLDNEEPAPEDEVDAPFAARMQPEPLSVRLSKTVNGLLTSGKPDVVHALHKLEMIVGDLKTSLPAAIKASEGLADEWLAEDLESILAVL